MYKIQLTGILGRDIEPKKNKTGGTFYTTSIAVKKGFSKDEQTEWVNLIFNEKAENAAPYLLKGTKLLLEGTPSINTYEKDGKTIANMQVSIYSFEFIGDKKTQDTSLTEDKIPF